MASCIRFRRGQAVIVPACCNAGACHSAIRGSSDRRLRRPAEAVTGIPYGYRVPASPGQTACATTPHDEESPSHARLSGVSKKEENLLPYYRCFRPDDHYFIAIRADSEIFGLTGNIYFHIYPDSIVKNYPYKYRLPSSTRLSNIHISKKNRESRNSLTSPSP